MRMDSSNCRTIARVDDERYRAGMSDWPRILRVCIEVPRGSHIKREAGGRIDFISPVPCPFNYGSVEAAPAPDGDAPDAIVLGERLGVGVQVELPVLARVHFVDGGLDDHKWVVGQEPMNADEERSLRRFFTVYAGVKRLLNHLRGGGSPSRFGGIDRAPGT
jgi:inorganic pyrophosphatase